MVKSLTKALFLDTMIKSIIKKDSLFSLNHLQLFAVQHPCDADTTSLRDEFNNYLFSPVFCVFGFLFKKIFLQLK